MSEIAMYTENTHQILQELFVDVSEFGCEFYGSI